MTSLFVLNVDDFRPLVQAAGTDPDVTVSRRGPYFQVSAPGSITIARDATGCRNAIWYSSVAAVKDGRISQWDKHVLRIEPVDSSAVPADSRSGLHPDRRAPGTNVNVLHEG